MKVFKRCGFAFAVPAIALLLCSVLVPSCLAASFFTQQPPQDTPSSPAVPEYSTPPALQEPLAPPPIAVETDKTPSKTLRQETVPGPGARQTKNDESHLTNFIDKWIEAKRKGNPDQIACFYGNSVHFYNASYTRGDVASENMRFLKRWPEVSYTRLGEVRCLGTCSGSPLTVEVLVAYETKSFERKKCSLGTARQQFTLEEFNDVLGYRIIGEDQTIVEKRNNFDMSNGICTQ